tara:strand:- start:7306 stop:13473 length:6168 start_codon:yes stop_codon:yes gene_type:complete
MLNQEINQNYLYPRKRTQPTHKVIDDVAGLNVRESPSLFDVGEVNQLPPKIYELPASAKVIVLDEALGFEGKWVKIQYATPDENIVGYCYGRYLLRLPNTPKYNKAEVLMPMDLSPLPYSKEWYSNEDMDFWFDESQNTYFTVLLTKYETPGGSKLEQRLSEYYTPGIKNILLQTDKRDDQEIIDKILEGYSFGFVYDYYIDPRPRAKMKVLVGVHKKYIQPLKDKQQYGDVYIERGVKHRIKFCAAGFSPLHQAEDILMKYHTDTENFPGSIEVDLPYEAENLAAFRNDLEEFLLKNSVDISSASVMIEIGMDQDFGLKYVRKTDGIERRYLMKSFSNLRESRGAMSPRTMAIVWNSYDIISSYSKSVPLIEFLQLYIYPMPRVSYSQDRKKSVDISFSNIKDRIDSFPIKDAAQKIAEDEILSSVNLLMGKYNQRRLESFPSGDFIFENLKKISKQIQDLDGLYENLLNKIDINSLIETALCQMVKSTDSLDVVDAFYDAAVSANIVRKKKFVEMIDRGDIPADVVSRYSKIRIKNNGDDLPPVTTIEQIDQVEKEKEKISQALTTSGPEKERVLSLLSPASKSMLYEMEGTYEIDNYPEAGVKSKISCGLIGEPNSGVKIGNKIVPKSAPSTAGPLPDLNKAADMMNGNSQVTPDYFCYDPPPHAPKVVSSRGDDGVKEFLQKNACKLFAGVSDFYQGLPTSPDAEFSPKLPEIPTSLTMNFVDDLSTPNYLEDLDKAVELFLDKTVETSIQAPIKSLIGGILSQVSSLDADEMFGEFSVSDFIEDVGEAIKESGVLDQHIDAVGEMLDDVFNMVLGKEVPDLFAGNLPESSLQPIYLYSKEKYPEVKEVTGDIGTFRKFFIDMGKSADEEKLQEIPVGQSDFSYQSLFCGSPDDSLRENLLAKGVESPDEEIEKKKKSDREKIRDLASMLANPDEHFSSPIPDNDCAASSEDPSFTALSSPMSLAYMEQQTMNNTFEGMYPLFNNEVDSTVQDMISIETAQVRKDINLSYVVDGEKKWIKNPSLLGKEVNLPGITESEATEDTPSRYVYTSDGAPVGSRGEDPMPSISIEITEKVPLSIFQDNGYVKDTAPSIISRTDGLSANFRIQSKTGDIGSVDLMYPSIEQIEINEGDTILTRDNLVLNIQSEVLEFTGSLSASNTTDRQVESFIEEQIVTEFPLGFARYSPQSVVFGKMISDSWSLIMNENNKNLIQNELRTHYTKDVFSKATKDFYRQIGRQVQSADALKSQLASDSSSDLAVSIVNNIKTYNFSPAPPPQTELDACAKTPTVINVDEILGSTMSDCPVSDTEDNKSLEVSMLLMVRVYIAEFLFKSMCPTQRLPVLSTPDNLTISYLAREMLASIERIEGAGFRRDFVEKGYDLISKYREEGKIAPLEETSEDDGVYFFGEGNLESQISLLIEREWPVVYDNFIKVVSPNMSSTIEDVVRTTVPIIDVATSTNDTAAGRFFLPDPSLTQFDKPVLISESDIPEPPPGNTIISTLRAGTEDQRELLNQVNLLVENGQVFGEGFLPPSLPDLFGAPEIKTSTVGELIDSIGDFPEATRQARIEEVVEEVLQRMRSYLVETEGTIEFRRFEQQGELANVGSLGEDSVEVSLDDGQFIIERFIKVEDKATADARIRNRFLQPGYDGTLGYVNLAEWTSWVSSAIEEGIIDPSKSLEEYFDSWELGMRLVYVAPLTDFETSPEWERELDEGSTPTEDVASASGEEDASVGFLEVTTSAPETFYTVPNEAAEFPAAYDDIISQVVDNDVFSRVKAYKITEAATSVGTSGTQILYGNSDAGISQIGSTSFERVERKIYSTPLVEVGKLLNPKSSIESSLAFLSPNPLLREQYDLLLKEMTEDMKFRSLFEFCFPLGTFSSAYAIYSQVATDAVYGTQESFDKSKEYLSSVISAVENVQDYTYQDRKVVRGNKTAKKPTIFDSVATIVKYLAEFTDTNIRLAKIIAGDDPTKLMAASMGLLPKNIFPQPPFGPGIGPELTGLGISYIAFELARMLESKSKGKSGSKLLNSKTCDAADAAQKEQDEQIKKVVG